MTVATVVGPGPGEQWLRSPRLWRIECCVKRMILCNHHVGTVTVALDRGWFSHFLRRADCRFQGRELGSSYSSGPFPAGIQDVPDHFILE